MLRKRKPKVLTPEQVEEIRTKDFFDMILPGTIKFLSDHYIVGDSYRCVWAIREYPPSTEEQAIFSQLLSAVPTGSNQFGAQYERVLPASSVANLYPFNFSGKTDPQGAYIGRDKYGTNILVDFDRRAEDKTNSNALILGNSGQGKSYLLKLILTNIRESGKK